MIVETCFEVEHATATWKNTMRASRQSVYPLACAAILLFSAGPFAGAMAVSIDQEFTLGKLYKPSAGKVNCFNSPAWTTLVTTYPHRPLVSSTRDRHENSPTVRVVG